MLIAYKTNEYFIQKLLHLSFYSFKVCSQLNNQLDKQKEKYSQKLEFLNVKYKQEEFLFNKLFLIKNTCCESCKLLISSPPSSYISTPEREISTNSEDDLPPIIPSDDAIRLYRVELELAEKKLALTQALCDNQELTRQLQRSTSTLSDSDAISLSSMRSVNQNSTVSWLSKTVNSIKEAANSSNRTKVN